ncbi:MFS transporter (plasmid) [Streptomyces sp. NBC_00335]|uniref:MFS transporter n=1 Tax=unclassified Streptomyces TaxID=2593676 RepID=UPI0022542F7D|nr:MULTISPECIES: MFS transporter [unclassified Streptomyces]MCX5410115.1 MFS transporter [Streptomyces sp. NBC_00086]
MTLLEERPAPGEPEARATPLRRNRDFLLLWTGAGFSLLGVQAAQAAYPLLMIWQGSVAGAGLVGFAALLPHLLVQLPAGALVDRWDRRKLMILCDLVGLLSMGSVAAALATGHMWLPHVMAAAFLEGAAFVFYRLAERAAVRNVVHPAHLPAALSQNEARSQVAGLLGQPAGVALFALTRWLPFGVTALAHLVALGCVLFIRKELQEERTAAPRSLRAEVSEGVAWVWRQKFMRAAVALVAGSNMLFQILNLSLVLIFKEAGHSPALLGVLGLMEGVGGALGALSASWCLKRLAPSTVVISAFALWAALMAPVAFLSAPLALGALCGGMAFAGSLMNVGAGVHQMRITPDEMQGRVSSVFMLMASGMNSAGALLGGLLLAAFPTSTTVLGISAAMALMTVLAAVNPAIRGAGREPEAGPAADPKAAGPQASPAIEDRATAIATAAGTAPHAEPRPVPRTAAGSDTSDEKVDPS